MSFDIFLQCFRNGKSATFERAIFDESFPAYFVDRERYPGLMRIEYSDGGGADIYVDDGDHVGGMMFNHCGGDAFFDALYELARQTGSVIFWPGVGRTSVIADPTMIRHLPADLIESCGEPVLVHDRVGIMEAIRNT
jgi:hypothetical protein